MYKSVTAQKPYLKTVQRYLTKLTTKIHTRSDVFTQIRIEKDGSHLGTQVNIICICLVESENFENEYTIVVQCWKRNFLKMSFLGKFFSRTIAVWNNMLSKNQFGKGIKK